MHVPLSEAHTLLPAKSRVIVGLSGGVDSSVTAAILRDQGHEVIGVMLHLWEPESPDAPPSRCCAPDDIDDARRIADQLSLPFYVFERKELFLEHVVEPFVKAYAEGRTPSPCNDCNRHVKIAVLLELANLFGASMIATGHYARVMRSDSASPARLFRGLSEQKDQSYFLYGIGRPALDRLITPLGSLEKPAVRELAKQFGLATASKPDSEDLCFVGEDHARFVEDRMKPRPGPIVDPDGRTIGTHSGVHRFTIGQRKGLGVAIGQPAYVTKIDAEKATVHLGLAHDLDTHGAFLEEFVSLDESALAMGPVLARIRYRHAGVPASCDVLKNERALVRFEVPTRAVTPGQVCVLYRDGEVLGGGRIASSTEFGGAR